VKARLVFPRTQNDHINNLKQSQIQTTRAKSARKWIRSKAGVSRSNPACAATSEKDRSSAHLQMDWARLDSAVRSWTSGTAQGVMSYWFFTLAVSVREFIQGRVYYSGESPSLSESYEKPVRMISMLWAGLVGLLLIPVASAQSYTPEAAGMRMTAMSWILGNIEQVTLMVLAMYLVSKTGAKGLMLAYFVRSARATPVDVFIKMADAMTPANELGAISAAIGAVLIGGTLTILTRVSDWLKTPAANHNRPLTAVEANASRALVRELRSTVEDLFIAVQQRNTELRQASQREQAAIDAYKLMMSSANTATSEKEVAERNFVTAQRKLEEAIRAQQVSAEQ